LIDCLLQENHIAKDLNKAQKLEQDHKNRYSIEDRLLKRHSKLIVAKPVYIALIVTIYYGIIIAYPGKSKTK
jgi:single-stranded DNA-specific DHH superfamily exonuclease